MSPLTPDPLPSPLPVLADLPEGTDVLVVPRDPGSGARGVTPARHDGELG